MVIQRIQSVYLLIAIILMAVFAFFPALTFQLGGRDFVYGALEAGKVGVTHIDPLMLMLIILIVFLAIVDIFYAGCHWCSGMCHRQQGWCFNDLAMVSYPACTFHHFPHAGSQGHVQ